MASDKVGNGTGSGMPPTASEPSRTYVNHLSVTLLLSEVMLDFGQLFPAGPSARPVSQLVTSPVHLRRFGQQLAGTIVRYEARYGPLPEVEPDGEG